MRFNHFWRKFSHVKLAVIAPLACFYPINPAQAAFTLLDDFQALQAGAIDGQGSWQARSAQFLVTREPTVPTNQVLCLSPAPTAHSASLPLTLDNSTSTLFFRLQRTTAWSFTANPDLPTAPITTGTDTSHVAGLADLDPSLDAIVANTAKPSGINVNVAANIWAYFWMILHADSKTSEIWASVESSQAPQYQLINDANGNGEFRFGSNEGQNRKLFNLLITLGNDTQGLTYIDDLYLDATSANLSAPVQLAPAGESVPEPAIATLSALAALGLLRRRR